MQITNIQVVYQPIPFIVVNFDNVGGVADGIAINDIQFNELGKYVQLFTEQQAVLNKYVVAEKGTYNQNGTLLDCITFESAFILPEEPIDQTITFYNEGVLFQGTEGLTAQERCVNINNLGIVRAFYKAAVVTFQLPKNLAFLTDDFFTEYDWTNKNIGLSSVLVVGQYTAPMSGIWEVTCCILSPIATPEIYFTQVIV